MLLKIINHTRKEPRGRADLVRLIRYLFTPKEADERLLGAPEMTKLSLVSPPYGKDIRLAADELADQMLAYCRAACEGRPTPDVWYVHIVVAFAPSARAALSNPANKTATGRWGPLPVNACSISKDVLASFGWTRSHPTLFVVHGDTQHVHVHVVPVIPQIGIHPDWDILRISRRALNAAAKACAARFGIPYEPGAAIVPGKTIVGQAAPRPSTAVRCQGVSGAHAGHATPAGFGRDRGRSTPIAADLPVHRAAGEGGLVRPQ